MGNRKGMKPEKICSTNPKGSLIGTMGGSRPKYLGPHPSPSFPSPSFPFLSLFLLSALRSSPP